MVRVWCVKADRLNPNSNLARCRVFLVGRHRMRADWLYERNLAMGGSEL